MSTTERKRRPKVIYGPVKAKQIGYWHVVDAFGRAVLRVEVNKATPGSCKKVIGLGGHNGFAKL